MFEKIVMGFPENWQTFVRVILLPVSWIPSLQDTLIQFSLYSDYPVWRATKWIFILLPSLLFIVSMWVTMLSIYTYPFRRNRNIYVSILFVSWWDSLRSVWLFWVGAVQFLWLAIGWFWGMTKIAIGTIFEAIRQIIYYPFLLLGHLGTRYFRPGIPWIAIIFTLCWVFLEAMIFTYVLSPTMFEILSNLVGVETHTYLDPVLFIFLSVLIGGSFACIYWLGEAVKKKDIIQIVGMVIWELCVIMVEIMFLYRDLVDSIAPWLAQKTGVELGFVSTLVIATIAWIGIRAMTWFLFARYGISTLIAIIARYEIKGVEKVVEKHIEAPLMGVKALLNDFKSEADWFHAKGKEILEALALPALQVIAAGINCLMIFMSSKPIFSLPFKHIEEVMETQELLKMLEKQHKAKDE